MNAISRLPRGALPCRPISHCQKRYCYNKRQSGGGEEVTFAVLGIVGTGTFFGGLFGLAQGLAKRRQEERDGDENIERETPGIAAREMTKGLMVGAGSALKGLLVVGGGTLLITTCFLECPGCTLVGLGCLAIVKITRL